MAPDFTPEFVDRYNQPGPRYTSYPTVPAWTRPFTADHYRDALRDLATQPADELAVYFHVPFCAKHCHYCGCNALVSREKGVVDGYLDRVERELEMVTSIIGTRREVVQLHWGGGTPNYLDERQTERALGLFRQAFDVVPEAEVSLEIDPRIASPEQTLFLRRLGFNRISLGVQDFDEGTQKAIGRRQSRDKTLQVYAGCRDADFDGVNIDLVYGLPGQTQETFERTLGEIVDLSPDRVACFSYAHVPWIRPEQNRADTTIMAKGFDKFRLFQSSVEAFTAADYTWIGIDHFARTDDELSRALAERKLHRNFMGYATRPAPHMLAFGMSGIGDVCDRFVQNDPDLAGWSAGVDARGFPVVKGHELDREDRLRRLVVLNIMCNLELPWSLTEAGFGAPADELLKADLPGLEPLIDDGLVERDDRGLRITTRGRYFVRNVAMVFDAYLGRKQDGPLFSKTV